MQRNTLIVVGAIVCIAIIVGGFLGYTYITGTAKPSTEEKYIKIGFICPLTGPYSDYGQRMLYSAKMVVEEVNNNGGIEIDGKKMNLTLVLEDNESKVEKGRSAILDLILAKGVNVIVGEIHSSILLNYIDIPDKYEVPFINTACQSMRILNLTRDTPYKYMFNLSPTSLGDAQSDAQATLQCLEGEVSKIALCAENSEAAIEHISQYRDYIEEHAPQIQFVSKDLYELGTLDFYAVLAKWKSLGVDLVYGSVWGASATAFCEQFYEVFGRPQFIASHPSILAVTGNWQDKTFVAEHADWVDLHMCDVGWTSDLPLTSLTIPVSTLYNQTWGVEMHRWAAQQYDGMLIMVEALKTAKSLVPEDIVQALETVTVTGVRLQLEFGEDHYCPTKNVVAQIQDGGYVYVWPDEVKTGTVDLGR